jgi:hypothetical protein
MATMTKIIKQTTTRSMGECPACRREITAEVDIVVTLADALVTDKFKVHVSATPAITRVRIEHDCAGTQASAIDDFVVHLVDRTYNAACWPEERRGEAHHATEVLADVTCPFCQAWTVRS